MNVNCYECIICLSLNHASRLHCQNCGTVPARYSVTKKPIRISTVNDFSVTEVIVAIGAERASQKRCSRVGLRTVSVTYYAEE